MKKFLLTIICFGFLSCSAQTIKGFVSEDYIPSGFFGSWGVISKLKSTNNSQLFNKESRDIWTLSGYSNVLILQNPQSGASSKIIIEEKNQDGKTLKFKRRKVVVENGEKKIYQEIVSFVLSQDKFFGTDEFIVEQYDSKNNLIKKNQAQYSIHGVKIEGKSPLNQFAKTR